MSGSLSTAACSGVLTNFAKKDMAWMSGVPQAQPLEQTLHPGDSESVCIQYDLNFTCAYIAASGLAEDAALLLTEMLAREKKRPKAGIPTGCQPVILKILTYSRVKSTASYYYEVESAVAATLLSAIAA